MSKTDGRRARRSSFLAKKIFSFPPRYPKTFKRNFALSRGGHFSGLRNTQIKILRARHVLFAFITVHLFLALSFYKNNVINSNNLKNLFNAVCMAHIIYIFRKL